MKFIAHDIKSRVSGTISEVRTVRNLLRVEANEYDDEDYRYLMNSSNEFLTGLLPKVLRTLEGWDRSYELIDRRTEYQDASMLDLSPFCLDGIELRDYQLKAARKALWKGRGIIDIPTRAGKTEIAFAIIDKLDKPTLFLVNRTNLAVQTAERAEERGFSDVQVLRAGEMREPARLNVAMIQTLYQALKGQDPALFQLLQQMEVVVFDETHHVGSKQWSYIGVNCPAPYRYGLSATPFEHLEADDRSYRDMVLQGLTGEVIIRIPPSYLIKRGYIALPKVTFLPVNSRKIYGWEWHSVYKEGIVYNWQRNQLGAKIAASLFEEGHKVLLLVDQIDHGKILLKMLADEGLEDVVFVKGGQMSFRFSAADGEYIENPSAAGEVLRYFEERDRAVLIGSKVLNEGLDFPALNSLIMMGGKKSYKQTLQRVGRPLTPKDGKNEVYVYDFVDLSHPYLKKHSRQRRKIYKRAGYQVTSTSGI